MHKSWQSVFARIDAGMPPGQTFVPPPSINSGATLQAAAVPAGGTALSGPGDDSAKVLQLIAAYQARGHNVSDLDPLGMYDADLDGSIPPDLELSNYGFTEADMEKEFHLGVLMSSGFLSNNNKPMKLREIVDRCNQVRVRAWAWACRHTFCLRRAAAATHGNHHVQQKPPLRTRTRTNRGTATAPRAQPQRHAHVFGAPLLLCHSSHHAAAKPTAARCTRTTSASSTCISGTTSRSTGSASRSRRRRRWSSARRRSYACSTACAGERERSVRERSTPWHLAAHAPALSTTRPPKPHALVPSTQARLMTRDGLQTVRWPHGMVV